MIEYDLKSQLIADYNDILVIAFYLNDDLMTIVSGEAEHMMEFLADVFGK